MIDIASFTRLRTSEQVPVRVWSCCTFVLPNRQKLLSYMGRRCEKWLSVGDRTRNLLLHLLVPPVKRRKGPLPFKQWSCQTKTRQEFERLAPNSRYGIFFKFKFELRGKTVSKKNTNGKIPVSNSRVGYPKLAQPVTCETRKCSTASDVELLWIEARRFLTSFFSWSTRIWSSEKILKTGGGPYFSLHAQ